MMMKLGAFVSLLGAIAWSGAAYAAPDRPGVVCKASGGLRAVVSIDYVVDATDYDLNAAKIVVGYPSTVSLPGKGSADTVRERVRSLQGKQASDVRVVAHDLDGDPTSAKLNVIVASFADTKDRFDDGVRPGEAIAIAFDCVDGAQISDSDFTCAIESANDILSNPLQVTCSVKAGPP